MNNVPLHEENEALNVNWCELTIRNNKGYLVYKNYWITNYLISKKNVADITKSGRALWNIKNENILYSLEGLALFLVIQNV